MPFALIVLSGDTQRPGLVVGQAGAALAFLLVGAGLHTVQTVGPGAGDRSRAAANRARASWPCSASCCCSAWSSAPSLFGALLATFQPDRLIQVIQGAAVATMLLNCIALWKQEPRDPRRRGPTCRAPAFRESWTTLQPRAATRRGCWWRSGSARPPSACRTSCWSPMAARSCTSPSAATTILTAAWPRAALAGFGPRRAQCSAGRRPAIGVAALGALAGIAAFSAVIFAAPLESPLLFAARHGPDRLRRRPVRARHADRRDGAGAGRRERSWRSAPGARCRRRRPGLAIASRRRHPRRRLQPGRTGRARRRRWPTRPPATASSTTSRSPCCSPPWSRSARSCAREPSVTDQPRHLRPRRIPRLANQHAEVMRWRRRHHQLHRCGPSRAVCVLDLLRRPDLLSRRRTSARATRCCRKFRPCAWCRASRRSPRPRTSCSATAAYSAPRGEATTARSTRKRPASGPARRWSPPAIR